MVSARLKRDSGSEIAVLTVDIGLFLLPISIAFGITVRQYQEEEGYSYHAPERSAWR
jgi:hypothetical protein